MKLDAVIFDMDGTITDTEKFYNRTWPLALPPAVILILPEKMP